MNKFVAVRKAGVWVLTVYTECDESNPNVGSSETTEFRTYRAMIDYLEHSESEAKE